MTWCFLYSIICRFLKPLSLLYSQIMYIHERTNCIHHLNSKSYKHPIARSDAVANTLIITYI
ncbi:unnamed protein product [Periconia digitata]|uniref:Uncharacterized protein n=1 Tax=Periconia digitata TaxID=1303443 RepID=A0A9W4UIC0_9PLEO|nr:unnamed protein product [Periconia digitata]